MTDLGHPDPLLTLLCWSFVGSMVTLIGAAYTAVVAKAALKLHRQRMALVRRSAR